MIESVPAIRARSLSAGYVNRRVLHDLDFEVAGGETAVMVGPGGAGKSTFLRALSGEAFSELGFWRTGELVLPGPTPCMLRQKPGRGGGTVAELFCEERCRECWSCAPEAARLLAPISQSPLHMLPVGLLRLVAFTATVAHDHSPYLLLDEPTADMEPWVQDWVIRKLRSLRGTTTVVLVTHNLRLARAVADSVHLMIDGEIWEAAPVERFFSQPQHPRTRHFVRMGC